MVALAHGVGLWRDRTHFGRHQKSGSLTNSRFMNYCARRSKHLKNRGHIRVFGGKRKKKKCLGKSLELDRGASEETDQKNGIERYPRVKGKI